MKVYAARYSDCTAESAMGVLSLHATHEGAHTAMAAHRDQCRAEHEEFLQRNPDIDGQWTDEHGDGFNAWDVKEYEVLP